MFLTATRPSQFPIAVSANKRYLVDAHGVPFIMCGDGGAQSLAQQLPATVAQYLAIRKSQGINALWVHVMMNQLDGANNTTNGATKDGIQPFTGVLSGSIGDAFPVYDFTTPNPLYFNRLELILQMCEGAGMVVLLDAMENDSYLNVCQANANAGMTALGNYLATRFISTPNIVWMTGNDFQSWSTTPSDNQLALHLMTAFATTDPKKLQTVELDYNMSKTSNNTLLSPLITLPNAYTYYPNYFEVGQQYAANAGPTYLIESYYEGIPFGNLTPNQLFTTGLRRIPWWTMLAGGLAGYFYGSQWFDFGTGWPAGIQTTAVANLQVWANFFNSIAFWKLVPDTTQSVCTAGFGTPTGNLAGRIDTDNYVTTASAADGSLAVLYCPTSTTVTVNMATFRGTVTVQKVDPTTGGLTSLGTFANSGTQNFVISGNNAANDPDFALVMTA